MEDEEHAVSCPGICCRSLLLLLLFWEDVNDTAATECSGWCLWDDVASGPPSSWVVDGGPWGCRFLGRLLLLLP